MRTFRLLMFAVATFIGAALIVTHARAQAPQAIAFTAPAGRATDAPPFVVSATGGGSGNPVTFSSQSTATCVTTGANGSTVTLMGLAGQCTIRASQAGNGAFLPAPDVDRTFAITPSVAGVPLISNAAGTGAPGANVSGVPATTASTFSPNGLARDTAGNIYIAESNSCRVRRIDPAGIITNVAGSGNCTTSGDGGPALAAGIRFARAIALDGAGNLYIAENSSHLVRKVTPGGTITTFAGTGVQGFGGDGGPAGAALLFEPRGVTADAAGNVYIADSGNNRIRRVALDGTITTIAGTGDFRFGGDGGPATLAGMNEPEAIAVNAAGVLFIGEYNSPRIRKVDTQGIITTIAGTGQRGVAGQGVVAKGAPLDTPIGFAFGSSGDLFVTEAGVYSVRKITASGLTYTIAGTGQRVNGPDGIPAKLSAVHYPYGLAVANDGSLLIAEAEGNRVRRVSFPAPTVPDAPVITNVTVTFGQVLLDVQAPNDGNASILDFTITCGALVTTKTTPPFLITGFAPDTAYSCTVKARNSVGSGPSSLPTANATPTPSAPAFLSAPPGSGLALQNYAYTVVATGLPAPTFAVTQGALPPGLSLDAVTGLISGPPTAGGTFTGVITASNGVNPAATQPFSITIYKLGQEIGFDETPPVLTVGASTVVVLYSSESGLPIVVTSKTPATCTTSGADGTTITGVAVGTCTLAANQAGNEVYDPAQEATMSFAVGPAIVPANPPRLANLSTRMQVLTGNDVLIGGFIIGGSQAKTVVVRARGPSLVALGVPNALANPVLQLFSGATQIAANDNWQEAANAAQLQASGFAPADPFEAAIHTTLAPGAYTGIVTGFGGGTGVGIIEVFEVDLPQVPLLNIATRGKVLTGGDVMIGGFIIQGDAPQTVIVRARGPSLAAQGVPGVLANPVLQLFAGAAQIAVNDNWGDSPDAAVIQAAGFAPADALESVIRVTLQPGAYTAIVTGAGGTTGVAIIEVFAQ